MTGTLELSSLSAQEQSLWSRVDELWRLAQQCDESAIRAALHPDYAGWDMNSPRPHQRDAAVQSVVQSGRQLKSYTLWPHSVRVYDAHTGVVHYAFRATLEANGHRTEVTGRWTEVYVLQEGVWLMIAVSGRPDAS